jgi:hypothetical protein
MQVKKLISANPNRWVDNLGMVLFKCMLVKKLICDNPNSNRLVDNTGILVLFTVSQ